MLLQYPAPSLPKPLLYSPLRLCLFPGEQPPRRLSAGQCRGSHPAKGLTGLNPSQRRQSTSPYLPQAAPRRSGLGLQEEVRGPRRRLERPLTWMSLFRTLPTAGKEPSACCCWMIQLLEAASSRGSTKIKLRACAKDFRTKAVSLKENRASPEGLQNGQPPRAG